MGVVRPSHVSPSVSCTGRGWRPLRRPRCAARTTCTCGAPARCEPYRCRWGDRVAGRSGEVVRQGGDSFMAPARHQEAVTRVRSRCVRQQRRTFAVRHSAWAKFFGSGAHFVLPATRYPPGPAPPAIPASVSGPVPPPAARITESGPEPIFSAPVKSPQCTGPAPRTQAKSSPPRCDAARPDEPPRSQRPPPAREANDADPFRCYPQPPHRTASHTVTDRDDPSETDDAAAVRGASAGIPEQCTPAVVSTILEAKEWRADRRWLYPAVGFALSAFADRRMQRVGS
jgi:hypothetical protein